MSPKTSRQTQARRVSEQLTRERIVTTALQLVDADGIEALTMRALADALDVYPAAVYWHVGSKANLMTLIAGRLFDELSLPDERKLSWDAWLAEVVRQWRVVMHRHPNVAVIPAGMLMTSTAALPFTERFVGVLEHAGFAGARLADVYNAVLGYAFGWVSTELSQAPRDADDSWRSNFEESLTLLSGVAYPALTRNIDDLMNRTFLLRWESGRDRPLDSAFELGLSSLLSGLRQLVSEHDDRD